MSSFTRAQVIPLDPSAASLRSSVKRAAAKVIPLPIRKRFTRSLLIEDTNDGKTFIVRGAFKYFIGSEVSGRFISCPDGARTDLASIPRLLQPLVPKLGKGNQAAVVHDLAYRRGFVELGLRYGVGISRITRKEADQIMLEAMTVLEVGKSRRYAIYYGLRIGGWYGWNKAKRKRATNQAYYRLHGEVMAA